MSKTVQLKRGNANVSATYVGAEGEITVNTTDYTLNIHDGVTPGGYTVTGVGGGNIGNLNFTDQTISGLNNNQDIVIDSGNGRVYILQSVVSEGNIETTNYFLGNGRYLTGITAQANLGNIIIDGQNIFGLNEPQEPLVLGNGGLANVLVQGNLTVSNLQIFNANAGVIRTQFITVATENQFGDLSGYVFSSTGQILSNVGLLHRNQSIFNPNVSVLSLNHERPVAIFYSNLTNELIGNLVVTSSDRPHGPFSNAFVSAYSNVNSFSQVIHQNLNEGPIASTDFVATANNGDDVSYYVDLGIAGNLHVDPDFFGDTTSFNDAYLYVTAHDQAGPSTGNVGNLIIGSTNGVIKLFVGNTAEANVVAKITSNAILPGANVSYDLGSSTSQWRDLWVSNNTIYIGGVALGVSADGNLTVNGNTISTGTVTGNITVNLSEINFSANSSGDGNGYSTIQLVPDSTVVGNDQYIIVDPTAPGHIHIRAGGTQDNSSADLILGGEYSHVRIPAGANSTVYIKSNDYNWQFGSDGNLTIPGNINYGNGDSILANYATISSTLNTNTTSQSANDFVGGNYYNADTLSVEYTAYTGASTLNFNLGYQKPLDGNIGINVAAISTPLIQSHGNIVMTSNVGGVESSWSFGTDGSLSTPGNVIVNDTLFISGSIQPIGASPAPSLSGFSSISTVISGNPNEGNITAHNYLIANGGIITSGNITANYLIGNGSELTSVNAATVDILNTNGLGTTFYPTFVENRSDGQILRADVDLSYRTDTNTLTVNSISSSGNITGNTQGFAIGYRDVPQVVFTSNTTLALTDAGKHYFSSNSANVITVPNNATVSFNIGAAISIVQQGTANLTINPDSGVTLYLAGNATSSARTLGNYGMATLMKVGTDTWFINGTGLN